MQRCKPSASRRAACRQHTCPPPAITHQQLPRDKHQHAAAEAGLRVQRADVVLALLEGQRGQLAHDLQAAHGAKAAAQQVWSAASAVMLGMPMRRMAPAEHCCKLAQLMAAQHPACKQGGAVARNRRGPPAAAAACRRRWEPARGAARPAAAIRPCCAPARKLPGPQGTHRLRALELLSLKRQHRLVLVQPRQVGPRGVECGVEHVREGLRARQRGLGRLGRSVEPSPAPAAIPMTPRAPWPRTQGQPPSLPSAWAAGGGGLSAERSYRRSGTGERVVHEPISVLPPEREVSVGCCAACWGPMAAPNRSWAWRQPCTNRCAHDDTL